VKKIRVRIVETKRDGVQFKWTDAAGVPRQETYKGRETRNKIEEARLEIEDRINRTGSRLRWSKFWERYERRWLRKLSDQSQSKPQSVNRRFVELLKTQGLGDVECAELSADLVQELRETMEDEGLAEATISSNMATLWAALAWGADMGLLPRLHRPRNRRIKGDVAVASKGKGRPLTLEEIERMADKIRTNPKIGEIKGRPVFVRRPDENAEQVINAINAMRLLGLRLDDCHRLRWDISDKDHYLKLETRTPCICLCSAQKSGREQELPMTPDAVAWLRSLPRVGTYVCRLNGSKGLHKTPNRLGRIIANAGKAAGVVTKATGGKGGKAKYASAHDLRRTFVKTLLKLLDGNLHEARILSRHASIQTLLDYYADEDTAPLATKLRSLSSQSGGFLVDDSQAADKSESTETP
jgi:integrase